MADNRTMAQMLQAPIEGYEDAIVIPPINANNFELKQTLINLVQSNQFTGRQDPHNHLRFFNKVTSTFKNDENELVPTRLVTGWRVCIDYRKLNEATRKIISHFLSWTRC
nr:reverse transcriptase domain-containing protein [Tanacetum cinerariifolium]